MKTIKVKSEQLKGHNVRFCWWNKESANIGQQRLSSLNSKKEKKMEKKEQRL